MCDKSSALLSSPWNVPSTSPWLFFLTIKWVYEHVGAMDQTKISPCSLKFKRKFSDGSSSRKKKKPKSDTRLEPLKCPLSVSHIHSLPGTYQTSRDKIAKHVQGNGWMTTGGQQLCHSPLGLKVMIKVSMEKCLSLEMELESDFTCNCIWSEWVAVCLPPAIAQRLSFSHLENEEPDRIIGKTKISSYFNILEFLKGKRIKASSNPVWLLLNHFPISLVFSPWMDFFP